MTRSTLRCLAPLALAVVAACSAEPAEPTIAAVTDVTQAVTNCGPRPPRNDCANWICNPETESWEEDPFPEGVGCAGGQGTCDGAGSCRLPPPPPPPQAPPLPPLSDRTFYIETLGRRCYDVGGEAAWAPGQPVIIYGCNGTAAQQIRIKEIDSASHDVELRIRDRFCIGVRGGGGFVVPGQMLELQTCNGSPAQRFAIDGDAILVGSQNLGQRVNREWVIEPVGRSTLAGTRLHVLFRETDNSEYVRFNATDGSGSRPTSGFVSVTSEAQLDGALLLGWGTVIELNASFTLNSSQTKSLNSGVTLRGHRRFEDNGVELRDGGGPSGSALFISAEKTNVRITGFRLRGRADVATAPATNAILVHTPIDSRTFIDHMDITHWTGSGVQAAGGARVLTCPGTTPFWPRPENATIFGSFIARNRDYGVVTGDGAFLNIRGNHMYSNAHDIASDPWAATGYLATENIVMPPTAGGHDFDVHGSENPGHWHGGIAGDAFGISYNTFLTTNHPNINLRGTPCRFMEITENVTMHSADAWFASDSAAAASKAFLARNRFESSNPMGELGVGDFDGDGLDDVFVGTGAAWYYSSGGRSEWRYLNRMKERAGQLRFGDFDGDGRTDVLTVHGASIDLSFAGMTSWRTVSGTSQTLDDIAVGDFDGDGYADVFVATGTTWQYAPGARLFGHDFQHFATSSVRTWDLRFGDFNGDRRTDVLGVVSGQWMTVPGGGSTWMPLQGSLGAMSSLVVGDFDGDGIADVASATPTAWRYSKSARNGWVNLRTFATAEPLPGNQIGRFDRNATTDVVRYSGDWHFDYLPGASGPVTRIGRQIMR